MFFSACSIISETSGCVSSTDFSVVANYFFPTGGMCTAHTGGEISLNADQPEQDVIRDHPAHSMHTLPGDRCHTVAVGLTYP